MLAESRERSIDQARIDRGKFFVAQAQRFERTWPVVLHEYVGSQNQFFQNVSVSRLFEVERKRTFVGSLSEESRAHLAAVELPVGAREPRSEERRVGKEGGGGRASRLRKEV